MDLEDLKSDYKKGETDNVRTTECLKKMKQSGNHPVLRSIKKQLIFESIVWTILLVVYYDFFDGQLKSIVWNGLLIVSILLLLIHNILGYILVKNPIFGENIKESLQKYLTKIKKFSTLSILSRVLAVTILLGFLVSNIVWELHKILLFAGLLLFSIGIQIYFLRRVWNKRIGLIENKLNSF
ncbi:hypothetical protein [Confluentibacter sediminis]|uniref:hypothetical protein n=1 Tax=Confluentibacter sediminis TaxID=2219045 RepID=UPI000DAD3BBF|nr:hypothetical protein [Confluentibacter sediminis]